MSQYPLDPVIRRVDCSELPKKDSSSQKGVMLDKTGKHLLKKPWFGEVRTNSGNCITQFRNLLPANVITQKVGTVSPQYIHIMVNGECNDEWMNDELL